MTRTGAVSLVLLVALALVPEATAKGPVTLQICGTADCRKLHTSDHGRLVHGVFDLVDSFDFARWPPPAPYYELRFKEDSVRSWLGNGPMFLVLRHDALGIGGEWRRVPRRLSASLEGATRGLRPFAPPRLTKVVVDGARAPDPGPYSALLRRLPSTEEGWSPRRVSIAFHSGRVTPWTDPALPLDYYPRDRVLHRETEWLAVSPALAATIERDARLAPRVTGRERPLPWADLAAPGVAALVGSAAAALAVRRARRSRPAPA